MEPMPQLEAWNQQLADNPNAESADVDVAKRLLKHGIEALEELKRLRETLQGIADADWRKWEELATPEEFVRWVKARAMHALRPNYYSVAMRSLIRPPNPGSIRPPWEKSYLDSRVCRISPPNPAT